MKRKVLALGFFSALGLIFLISISVIIRVYIFRPYSIPSNSMTPTLMRGDYIFVNKLSYRSQEPQRGDVIVFHRSEDKTHYVKRIVGIPSDEIKEVDGVLFINGETVKTQDYTIKRSDVQNKCVAALDENSQSLVPEKFLPLPYFRQFKLFQQKIEYLPGQMHLIQRHKKMPVAMDFSVTVPEKKYFVMGDSRDESQDSRFWGFVERDYIDGKATHIWLSFNADRILCENQKSNWGGISYIRWDRFGRKIF